MSGKGYNVNADFMNVTTKARLRLVDSLHMCLIVFPELQQVPVKSSLLLAPSPELMAECS